MTRVICALFAAIFLWLVSLSAQALRIGVKDQYFEAGRFGKVYKSESPVNYWMYFGLHIILVPILLTAALACAALCYLNPLAR